MIAPQKPKGSADKIIIGKKYDLKAIESNDFEISNIVNPHEITF